jgi:NitT/TauT family transport system substrate-binding protein
MNRRHFLTITAAGLGATLSACKKPPNVSAGGKPIIRFGHFPNITHVQALVAHQLSRQGKGWFEEKLDAEIEWYTYNAGPSATEAIFGEALDVTYIGPSPVLNAYAVSNGAEMRVLAGAANGGNALVVRADAGISAPADFRGKKIATPQHGNTQDVQARAWLSDNGVKVGNRSEEASVRAVANADQLGLFVQKDLDAVWTAEPWVSRLELEGGGKLFIDDRETNVTLLAARAAWVSEHTELARKLLAAHRELTAWVIAHPAETKDLVKLELAALSKTAPNDEVIDRALSRVVITDAISRETLDKMVESAKKVGFLKDIPALDRLIVTP